MMDKYARIMQKLDMVNVELFKVSCDVIFSLVINYTCMEFVECLLLFILNIFFQGIFQLFGIFYHHIYETFGYQDRSQSGKPLHDSQSCMDYVFSDIFLAHGFLLLMLTNT